MEDTLKSMLSEKELMDLTEGDMEKMTDDELRRISWILESRGDERQHSGSPGRAEIGTYFIKKSKRILEFIDERHEAKRNAKACAAADRLNKAILKLNGVSHEVMFDWVKTEKTVEIECTKRGNRSVHIDMYEHVEKFSDYKLENYYAAYESLASAAELLFAGTQLASYVVKEDEEV